MSNDFHTIILVTHDNVRQVFYDSYNRNLNFRAHCGRKIMLIIFHTIFELEKAKLSIAKNNYFGTRSPIYKVLIPWSH